MFPNSLTLLVATVMFGEKGYDILAIDISDDLITLAKKNTSHPH